MALSKKQQIFVDEYLVDRNATQAAIRAGYSEKTAKQQGSRLLTNVDVAEAVDKAAADRSEKVARNATDAIKDIVRIAGIAEKSGDLKTAMRGYELEAKHHGGFIERKADVDTDGNDIDRAVEILFVKPKNAS